MQGRLGRWKERSRESREKLNRRRRGEGGGRGGVGLFGAASRGPPVDTSNTVVRRADQGARVSNMMYIPAVADWYSRCNCSPIK